MNRLRRCPKSGLRTEAGRRLRAAAMSLRMTCDSPISWPVVAFVMDVFSAMTTIPSPRLPQPPSADPIGGNRPLQRARCSGPVGRRGGPDDDACTGLALHVAGDLCVVVRLDLRHVGIDHAGPGPAQEWDTLTRGEHTRRGVLFIGDVI